MSVVPRISIITPTYNRCEVLERAIHSVQGQSCGEYEHLIVDDGSEDDTARLISGIRDERLIYLELPRNEGANIARNIGIQSARGEWITFLDSDDEYLPHRLETILETVERCRDTGLFISSFRSIKNGRVNDCRNAEADFTGPEFEEALMSYAVMIAGTSITVHRRLLQLSGGFAPNLKRLQDRQLLLALSRISGARVLSNIDWVKYNSQDSISEQRSGYVQAVDEMLKVHPELAVHYRTLLGYHISRTMVKMLLRSHLLNAIAEWRANLTAPHLKYGFWELLSGYVRGKRMRKSILDEIRKKHLSPVSQDKEAAIYCLSGNL